MNMATLRTGAINTILKRQSYFDWISFIVLQSQKSSFGVVFFPLEHYVLLLQILGIDRKLQDSLFREYFISFCNQTHVDKTLHI